VYIPRGKHRDTWLGHHGSKSVREIALRGDVPVELPSVPNVQIDKSVAISGASLSINGDSLR